MGRPEGHPLDAAAGAAEGGMTMDEYISRVETVKLLQALIGAAVTGPEQALV